MTRAEEIKQIALRLFAEKGYGATSIQDITAPVMIKKATFYSHFQSKKQLYILLMEEQAELIIDRTNTVLKESKATDLKGLLFDVFDAQVRMNFNRTHLLFWKRAIITQAGMSEKELQEDLSRITGRVNNTVVSAIQDALRAVSGDLRFECLSKCMFMYFIFLQGYLDWVLITNSLDEARVKIAWECFWNGMQGISG